MAAPKKTIDPERLHLVRQELEAIGLDPRHMENIECTLTAEGYSWCDKFINVGSLTISPRELIQDLLIEKLNPQDIRAKFFSHLTTRNQKVAFASAVHQCQQNAKSHVATHATTSATALPQRPMHAYAPHTYVHKYYGKQITLSANATAFEEAQRNSPHP